MGIEKSKATLAIYLDTHFSSAHDLLAAVKVFSAATAPVHGDGAQEPENESMQQPEHSNIAGVPWMILIARVEWEAGMFEFISAF